MHGAGHLITEGNKVGQMSFAFDKAILALPNHCLVLYVPGNGFQEDLLHNLPNTGQLGLPWIFQDNTCLSWGWTQHLWVFHSSSISPDCHYLSKMKKASLWQINQVAQHPWVQPIYSLWLMYVLSSCIVGDAPLPQTLPLCSGRPEGRTLQ